jgi:hypothetical protein
VGREVHYLSTCEGVLRIIQDRAAMSKPIAIVKPFSINGKTQCVRCDRWSRFLTMVGLCHKCCRRQRRHHQENDNVVAIPQPPTQRRPVVLRRHRQDDGDVVAIPEPPAQRRRIDDGEVAGPSQQNANDVGQPDPPRQRRRIIDSSSDGETEGQVVDWNLQFDLM